MSNAEERKKISIVMPAFNEEGNMDRAYEEITEACKHVGDYDYEVIVIDNASRDKTRDLAVALCQKDPRWKYVRFSRNFGAETSITVGMRLATGDVLINIFSDLQDPPEMISAFIKKWEETGADVVYGVIEDRHDLHPARGIAARAAYGLIKYCADIDIPRNAGDFRLITRRVKESLDQIHERERYVRGLVHWVGFEQVPLPYNRRPRRWGRSKAPFWWCFWFALNAITSFSTKPLRMFTIFGMVVLVFSVMLSFWYTIGHFLTNPPPGISTTLVLLSWNLAIMSLGIGILGEYIGHIYTETKKRPKCLVDEYMNMDGAFIEQAITEDS